MRDVSYVVLYNASMLGRTYTAFPAIIKRSLHETETITRARLLIVPSYKILMEVMCGVRRR
jgi:hypothetical protein